MNLAPDMLRGIHRSDQKLPFAVSKAGIENFQKRADAW